MRVVRFPTRPTRVSDDVRAAVASLGRGDTVVGGVAVLGATPPDSGIEIDAVLVLPRGVLVVVGVDLPDPAMTLTAPLNGAWKADGWPLVRGDEGAEEKADVNPGLKALSLAGRLADRVHALDPSIAVGVVIAVGPYVETVEQPPEDLAGPVRVVFPTAGSFLTATEALPVPERLLSTEQARAVLRDVAPSATDFDDAVLLAEGFTTPAAPDPPQAVLPAHWTSGSATVPVRAPRERGRLIRPAAALAAAALLVVAVTMAFLALTSQDSPTPASVEPPSNGHPAVHADGVRFDPVARDSASRCAPHHAVGDVQSFLLEHGCLEVLRGSFAATVEGRTFAVSVGAVTFPDAALAGEFEQLAATPGTGVLTDVATETHRWAGMHPTFEGAAFASRRDGATVRMVLAHHASLEAPSGSEGTATRVAAAALGLPLR